MFPKSVDKIISQFTKVIGELRATQAYHDNNANKHKALADFHHNEFLRSNDLIESFSKLLKL